MGNGIKKSPHPEEAAKRPSRRTHGRPADIAPDRGRQYAPPMVRLSSLLLALLLLSAVPAAAEEFVPGTEDLPLMKELSPVKGTDLVFDKPEGRIVEATARGKVTRKAVETFYAATLPQLGWKPAVSADSWTRETEALQLDFGGRDGDLWVTFTLLPK